MISIHDSYNATSEYLFESFYYYLRIIQSIIWSMIDPLFDPLFDNYSIQYFLQYLIQIIEFWENFNLIIWVGYDCN